MATLKKLLPKDGLSGLKENFAADALSGFLIFLLALPLSLGIAKAADFPPLMGLVTAIIGGLVVSTIAGSRLTIKGPAAGFIVIVAEAVIEFGHGDMTRGWHLALGAIVVAGIVQILFGVLKLGSFSDFFPASVVQGMLAAIGIIIFAKQIHVILGIDPAVFNGMNPIQLLAQIPTSIQNLNTNIAIIGIVSLIILFGFPLIKNEMIRRIPSPLVVLLVSIPLGIYFNFKEGPAYSLVKIDNFIKTISTDTIKVSFAGLGETLVFVKYVAMIALLGTIESLLTVKAIDSLDPYKRKSDYNKDLIAVGFGNVLSGIFGGLPMISEVARSSANVNNGAQTRWANFFHGLFLLIAVLTITPLIEMIPNAALSAMLIAVGYRLASPAEFKKTFSIGSEQLIIFITTIIVTLAEDLLLGVAAGILIKFIIEIYYYYFRPVGSMFTAKLKITDEGNNHYKVEVSDSANFVNLIGIKNKITKLPENANIKLDFTNTKIIDHTFMEQIHIMEEDMHRTGGHISLVGMEGLIANSQHQFAARRRAGANEVNPVVEQKLDKRQLSLRSFAAVNSLHFELKPAFSLIRMHYLPFALPRKAQYAENVIIGSKDTYQFFFSDIFVQESNFITKPQFKMTMLMVHDYMDALPDFSLEKEGLFYSLRGLAGSKDINFVDYPIFSKQYFLTGIDEEAIRNAFNPQVLTLLEEHTEYIIECHNHRLLIYKDTELLSIPEMEQAMVFVEKLVKAIKSTQPKDNRLFV